MSEHVENLKKGDYITIIQDKNPDPPMYSDFGYTPPKTSLSGEPYEVQAICVPFIVCHRLNGQVVTIDVREFAVRKVHWRYVDAFLEAPRSKRSHQFSPEKRGTSRKKKKKEKPDPKACPRCGCRMIETLKSAANWQLICPNCGGSFQLGETK